MTSAPPFSEEIARLEALNAELARRGVLCEACVTGAVVIAFVLASDPPTRSVGALFKPPDELGDATQAVASDHGLPSDWLTDTVRRYATSELEGGWLDLPNLRVFEAPAQYVLAMKSAALSVSQSPGDEDDIRFLLRLLNVREPEAALDIVHRYFKPSQLVPDVRGRLAALLPR